MGKGYVAYCRQSQKQIKKLEGKEYKKYGKKKVRRKFKNINIDFPEKYKKNKNLWIFKLGRTK